MKNGTLITIMNHDLGTQYRLNLPQNGEISRSVRRLCVSRLKTPPGYPGAGPLGEVGEQRPPETPGWAYTFEAVDGGGVRATPWAIRPQHDFRGNCFGHHMAQYPACREHQTKHRGECPDCPPCPACAEQLYAGTTGEAAKK